VFQYFAMPEFWKTLLAPLVGVLTLVCIMTRPFRRNEALTTMGGAGAVLARVTLGHIRARLGAKVAAGAK
jgi:hypothetical protein